MLYLGCDPDMHTCAFAVVNADLTLRWAWVERVTKKMKEHKAIVQMCRIIGGLHTGSYIAGVPPIEVGAAAVEAQELYLTGKSRTKNPRNILHLAAVAGSALTIFGQMFPQSDLHYPLPVQWKGSVPKLIHHHRILPKAGFLSDNIGEKLEKKRPEDDDKDKGYCFIKSIAGFCNVDPSVNQGDWKHLTDAIGLAQWAAKKHQEGKTKDLYLARARGTTIATPAVVSSQPHSGYIS